MWFCLCKTAITILKLYIIIETLYMTQYYKTCYYRRYLLYTYNVSYIRSTHVCRFTSQLCPCRCIRGYFDITTTNSCISVTTASTVTTAKSFSTNFGFFGSIAFISSTATLLPNGCQKPPL